MAGTNCKTLKKKLLAQATQDVQEKLDILVAEMDHLGKVIEEDTKSSAGDKYETSREMANSEREKLYLQIEENRKSLALLSTLSLEPSTIIGLGSLIKTSREWVFIAISLGQVKLAEEKVLMISPVTPLGQEFINKAKGDSVNFNRRNYKILGIC